MEKTGWSYLLENASSPQRDARQIALIRAYSWIEHALGACGFRKDNKNRSISDLLTQAHKQGYLKTPLEAVKLAIQVRHKAAHMDSVPPPEECTAAVMTLRDTWLSLRYFYICRPNILLWAQLICGKPGILSVNVFGSAARAFDPKNSGDIDFLIFDDGTYSLNVRLEDLRYLDRVRITRTALESLQINYFPFNHVMNCRWVDITILNGVRFGEDESYTKAIIANQPDPYFFLNIAPDIKEYNPTQNIFIPSSNSFFVKLREIRQELVALGFTQWIKK